MKTKKCTIERDGLMVLVGMAATIATCVVMLVT